VCEGFVGSEYYARSGKYGCQKCEEKYSIYLKLIGILFALICYVAFIVTIIISAPNRDQLSSVYARIITNYFQVILVVRNLDIQWPARIEALLNSISFVSSASEDLLQINCLIESDN
jgi:hypothetical protein